MIEHCVFFISELHVDRIKRQPLAISEEFQYIMDVCGKIDKYATLLLGVPSEK